LLDTVEKCGKSVNDTLPVERDRVCARLAAYLAK
jgi:hypothetical protein